MTSVDILDPVAFRKRRQIDGMLRTKIETAIDRLIDALDALDAPVEDLEDDDHDELEGDEEPSLGSTASISQALAWRSTTDRLYIDCEAEHDGREPSLGALVNWHGGPQLGWGLGDTRDLEEDAGDEGELDDDAEPSLGSFDRMMNQLKSWRQRAGWWGVDTEHDLADGPEGDDDRELDPAEDGIGDDGGLQEQMALAWGGLDPVDGEALR